MEPYRDSPFPVRDDLVDVHVATWRHLASPGSWFSGAERVAIKAEARNAERCRLCAERKAALSPYAVEGEHAHLGELPETLVEVLGSEALVDTAAVAALFNAIDRIADATGIRLEPWKAEQSADFRDALGINAFASMAHRPAPHLAYK